MIDYIKRKLRIGRYSDLAVNQRRGEFQNALMSLKEMFDQGIYDWRDTWMCCTPEGKNLQRLLDKHDMLHLLALNEKFLIERYGIALGKVLPVHAVHEKYDRPRAEVRKELFDFWCEELLGGAL